MCIVLQYVKHILQHSQKINGFDVNNVSVYCTVIINIFKNNLIFTFLGLQQQSSRINKPLQYILRRLRDITSILMVVLQMNPG